MPIWLRRWTFNEMRNHYTEEKDTIDGKQNSNGGKQTVINSDGTIKTPELLQKVASAKKPVKYG
jgi:hypothetical protein